VAVACHKAKPAHVEIDVTAAWPGASAEMMAASVTTPLEHELGQLHDAALAKITSYSTAGKMTIRLVFGGEDLAAAQPAVQQALASTMRMLPSSLPAPPAFVVPGPVVTRLAVPRDEAGAIALKMSQQPGVGLVETCGEPNKDVEVVVDGARLAAAGLTVSDVADALRTANEADIAGTKVAEREGAPVRLRDFAKVQASTQPPECVVVAPDANAAELVVHAQRAADVERVRAAVATLAGPHVTEVSSEHELHVEISPDVDTLAAASMLRTALASVDNAFFAEVRAGRAVVLAKTDAYLAAVSAAKGVTSAGEPTGVVYVSAPDPTVAAQLIAERLRQAHLLVATRGLATARATNVVVHRETAASLGVSNDMIDKTVAAANGGIVHVMFSQTGSYRLLMRVDPPESARVMATNGVAIPLTSLVQFQTVLEPVEGVHFGMLPAVELEVHGDPRDVIGAVPAGVTVTIE